MLKTYKRGDSIPDRWVSLHRREGHFLKPMWVLTFKLPWKARLYTINNDSFQLRHPRVSFCWVCISEGWFHQCSKEEMKRSDEIWYS